MKWFCKNTLYLAWVVSLSALLASLYYGEVLDVEPCRLCWYQRIGMFPLALFLGIATYKGDRRPALYSLPLVAFGGLFAFYQSISQMIPSLQVDALCGHSSHCTLPGFFPFFSAGGFAAIAILVALSFPRN